jgi:hypothetical protein
MVAGLSYALQELQPALSLSRDALAAAAQHQPTAAFADSWNSSTSSSSFEESSIGSSIHNDIDSYSSLSGTSSVQQPRPQEQQQQQRQPQQKQQEGGSSELLVQFIAGGVAGALAWASVYPLDVVKSRMQVRDVTHNEGCNLLERNMKCLC